MERSTPLFIGLFSFGSSFGQMLLPAGTGITVDEGTSLRVETTTIWTLEAGSTATNNGVIILGPEADLDEATGASMTGTGTERTTRDLATPLTDEDPGGLGGILSTGSALGTTSVVRGHTPYTDYSGHTSIARWLDFSPSNNNGLGATLDFRYDPAELNGMIEQDQRLHIRAGQDIWWPLASAVNTGTHTVGTSSLDSLGLFTTFDEDLPNSMASALHQGAFALLGAPGEQLWLSVPTGSRAEMLELFASDGALLISFSPKWGAGLHAVPDGAMAHGIYRLRVNARQTFTILRP